MATAHALTDERDERDGPGLALARSAFRKAGAAAAGLVLFTVSIALAVAVTLAVMTSAIAAVGEVREGSRLEGGSVFGDELATAPSESPGR